MKTGTRKRLSQKERKAVYELCGGHCAYCGKEIAIKEMQVDHYISFEFGLTIVQGKGEIDSMDN